MELINEGRNLDYTTLYCRLMDLILDNCWPKILIRARQNSGLPSSICLTKKTILIHRPEPNSRTFEDGAGLMEYPGLSLSLGG